ncbi:MAG: glucosamine inositolphosphorylceramide transferase family protein, partial [Chitinophagaceae bacterium]
MNNKLKVGILTGEVSYLWNDQLRVIRDIMDHPNMELCLFIQRSNEEKNHFEELTQQINSSAGNISKWLCRNQIKKEAKLFKEWKTVDPEKVISRIGLIKRLMVSPEKEGLLEKYSQQACEKIIPFNLDLIIDIDHKAIYSDNILSAAKFGVWRLHFGENLIPQTGPSGFSEIINRLPFCTVLLLQFLPGQEKIFVLDKAYYNRHWSFLKNFYDLHYAAISLLLKNLRKLLLVNPINATPIGHLLPPTVPGLKSKLRYFFNFYFRLATKVKEEISYKLFGTRRECWTLFWSQGDFFKTNINRITPQELPQDEFWADPFLYSYKNNTYVFFENYPYKRKIGKISVGNIEKGKVTNVRDILVKDYHLSYPQIIEEDGQLFLLPETGKNMRIEVYKCTKFPYGWELYSTAFEGEFVADTTYFQDVNGDRWLFLNKGGSINAELHIYKIDNLKLERIIPHSLNPVYIDCRKARNAGAIFMYQNEYYRPNQRCIYGVYG